MRVNLARSAALLALLPLALAIASAKQPDLTQAGRCVAAPALAEIPAGELTTSDRRGNSAPTKVSAFTIDREEVTVAQFRAFVEATGYTTEAEREGASPVFQSPLEPVAESPSAWWRMVQGASWRYPAGPNGAPAAPDEPVVHVTIADALAYARWAGRAIPTEAEWEWAARGGDQTKRTPAQWAYDAEGRPRANTWQGVFPYANSASDGYAGVAPVGCFEPNGYGVHDMVGNAWELTLESTGVGPVIKGGSHLCAFNYCANFMPAARMVQERNLGASHIGFRTIERVPGRQSRRESAPRFTRPAAG